MNLQRKLLMFALDKCSRPKKKKKEQLIIEKINPNFFFFSHQVTSNYIESLTFPSFSKEKEKEGKITKRRAIAAKNTELRTDELPRRTERIEKKMWGRKRQTDRK